MGILTEEIDPRLSDAISALISVLMRILSHSVGLMNSWLPLIAPISGQSMNIFFLSITLGSAYASAFSYYRIKGDSLFSFTYALTSIASESILRMAENLSREVNSLLGEL